MSALAKALLADLTETDLDQLAELLAPRLVDRFVKKSAAPTWLNARQAAEHMACPVSRIHDLVQLRLLTPRRDGRRLLFKREELDGYLEGSA